MLRIIAIGLLLTLAGPVVAQESKPPMLTAEVQKLAAEAGGSSLSGVGS